MDRRTFLRHGALVAAGAVAADQVELLQKLGGWTRRFFPSAAIAPAAITPKYVSVAELAAAYQRSVAPIVVAGRIAPFNELALWDLHASRYTAGR